MSVLKLASPCFRMVQAKRMNRCHSSIKDIQHRYQADLENKIQLVKEEISQLEKEKENMYSMDTMEELSAVLHDLKHKRHVGISGLMSVDECEPDFHYSVEYDV